MAKLKKLFNADYLQDAATQKQAVNEKNRAYIDRFVSENYIRLSNQFHNIGGVINSSCYGAMDKLNETIFSLYTDANLCFESWNDASAYLKNKFTDKEMRVVIKNYSKKERYKGNEYE